MVADGCPRWMTLSQRALLAQAVHLAFCVPGFALTGSRAEGGRYVEHHSFHEPRAGNNRIQEIPCPGCPRVGTTCCSGTTALLPPLIPSGEEENGQNLLVHFFASRSGQSTDALS